MAYIIIFVLLAAAIYLIALTIARPPRPRLSFNASDKTSSVTKNHFSFSALLIKKISLKINPPVFNSSYFKNLQNQAEFTGMRFGAIELLFIKEAAAIIAGILTAVLFAPTYALIAVLAGFFAPDIYLSNKIKAKKKAIIKYFPETVDLLDLCIGAGLDFLSAVRWVTEKSQNNPFVEQLKIVRKEIQTGKSRTEALKAMSRRLNIMDVSSFVRTLILAERMGASIEEALRNISEDTRASRFQRGEKEAIKASLKILIPLLFFILPVIMIVVAGPIIIKFTQGGLMTGM